MRRPLAGADKSRHGVMSPSNLTSMGQLSLVVRAYDAALAFYVGKLGFRLIEDSPVPEQNKRWVVIEPPGAEGRGAKLLLARAANPEQQSRIGNQTGGRVFLFLYTDDFWRDFNAYTAQGVEFVREPGDAPYGTGRCSRICTDCSMGPDRTPRDMTHRLTRA